MTTVARFEAMNTTKLNWWLSDSSLFETAYLENPFQDVHTQNYRDTGNTASKKSVQYPIQHAKLNFYETLLRKDLLNNSEYLFSSYIETIELANKLDEEENNASLPLAAYNRRLIEEKVAAQQSKKLGKSRHISMSHFAAIDKKYEMVKLPRLATRLPTIASRSNTIISNNNNILASNTSQVALNTSTNNARENTMMYDTVSIAASDFDATTSNNNANNINEKDAAVDSMGDVSDFDQINYLAVGLKYLENNPAAEDTRSLKKKKGRKVNGDIPDSGENSNNATASDESGRAGTEEATDLSKTTVYLASIGNVPNMYHERHVKVYRKSNHQWNNKNGVDSKKKKLTKLREAEQRRQQRTSTMPPNAADERPSINMDKSKMSLKEKFRINLEVDNAFKYTNLLDNRHYELSTNLIKLNFTSLQVKLPPPPTAGKASRTRTTEPGGDHKNSIANSKSLPLASVVLPSIHRNQNN
jgi:hypothetical protein